MVSDDAKKVQAEIKSRFRQHVVDLCAQTDLSDEEFWEREGNFSLDALGNLARLKRRPVKPQ